MCADSRLYLEQLSVGSHVCCIYRNVQQCLATLLPYVKAGLAAGQQVMCICDERRREQVLEALRLDGVDCASLLAGGQLLMQCSTSPFAPEGRLQWRLMVHWQQELTDEAIKRGYCALRVASQMEHVLQGLHDPRELREYEAAWNNFPARDRWIGMCMFDQDSIRPEQILDVLSTHPMVIFGASMHSNELFLSPLKMEDDAAGGPRLNYWLDALGHAKASGGQDAGERDAAALLADMPGFVYRCRNDEDWTLEYVSQGCYGLTGYPTGDLVFRSRLAFAQIIDPKDRLRVREEIQAALRQGRSFRTSYRITTVQGDEKWLLEQGRAVSGNGEVAAFEGLITDITQQGRDSQAMTAERDLLRTLVQASPVGIIMMDTAGKPSFSNDWAQKMLGLTHEQLRQLNVGSPDWGLCDTSGRPLEKHEYPHNEVLGTGRPVVGRRYLFRYMDRLPVMLQMTMAPLKASAGKIGGAIMALTDITEQHRAEERFAHIFHASPTGIVVSTFPEGVVLDMNESCLDITGFSREEAIGRRVRDLNIWLDLDVRRRLFERLVKERSVRNELVTMRRKSGQLLQVLIAAELIEMDGRECLLGFMHDITELKQAEQALRLERDFANTLLDTARAIVVVLDVQGRVVRFNSFAQELTGYAEAEVVGRPWMDVFIPDQEKQRISQVFQDSVAGKSIHGIENIVLAKDGRQLLIRWFDSVLRDPAGNAVAVLAVGHNITEIRRNEQQMRQAVKMEAIGRLAGGVAHDFNNQLTVVKGYCDLLMKELSDETARQSVEEIRKASLRAATLVNQLLAFGRKQSLKAQMVDLNDVLQQMLEPLQRLVGETVCLDLAPQRPLDLVEVDPALVEQAVLNLVINARDAMPDGGRLTIQTANVVLDDDDAAHGEATKGPAVMISFTDTGTGMDSEVRQHIFEPFFTTKPVGQGSGLGLSMVYGFVKQSGGHIQVISEKGRGTSFKLFLPRAQEVPLPPSIRAEGRTLTVLVAEDDQEFLQLIRRQLGGWGCKVLSCGNADQALSQSEQHEGAIDLLIADTDMPGLSGPELAGRVKAERPGLKILYLTGSAGEGEKLAGGKWSAGVLMKPFTPQALRAAVEAALAQSPPASS